MSSRRFSREEKGKGSSAELAQPPRTGRIKIQAPDTSALINKHSLTLIGRVTNKSVQKVWSLIPFFTDMWKAHGRPVGADLGNGLFQFQFDKEEDLLAVLEKRPFHFAKWLVIAQRWEPTASPSFPSLIPFWIKIQGIPVHLWTEEAVELLGSDIGIFEKAEITPFLVRMRVQVNGLLPLLKSSIIEYSNGDEVTVTFVYERLDKHCLKCCRLDHEIKDCLVAKHELKAAKQSEETSKASIQRKEPVREHYPDNSDVFRFSASRTKEDQPQRYVGRAPFDRRHDARRYLTDNRRARTPQDHSYRSHISHKTMEWRERSHEDNSHQRLNRSSRPRSPPERRSPSPRRHLTRIEEEERNATPPSSRNRGESLRREESSSSKDMMLGGTRGNPQQANFASPHQEALSAAREVVRETMIQYTQVADPTESAARRERLRQAKDRGTLEENALKLVKTSLKRKQTAIQASTTSTRTPATLRLGPAVQEQTEQPAKDTQTEEIAPKRKPGRPPGKRVEPALGEGKFHSPNRQPQDADSTPTSLQAVEHLRGQQALGNPGQDPMPPITRRISQYAT
ncbi:hypothetical protein Rs2_25829 [Raphanus sativus]|nr:hypothetical protein Rs2_25829 [Raphanus sativus]